MCLPTGREVFQILKCDDFIIQNYCKRTGQTKRNSLMKGKK